MRSEWLARLFLFGLLGGLGLVLLASWLLGRSGVITVHARLPEAGGWLPGDLVATVGEPLHLRLVSDDVLHGFAVGLLDAPALDLEPGKVVETTLLFERPGKYQYYCTRWCGPDHWRMRGTLEVRGAGQPLQAETPLYLALGLDLDAHRQTDTLPARRPDAARGALLDIRLPASYSDPAFLRSHSPADAWLELRRAPETTGLSDGAVWDLVALLWRAATTPARLAAGGELYAANCAACHGETGAGNGVMAPAVRAEFGGGGIDHGADGGPADFTDARRMLTTSPAILHGKVVRGGMGTGMPYWGPIFTNEQTWSLVEYLWTYQFDNLER